jgi:hypothetical protein
MSSVRKTIVCGACIALLSFISLTSPASAQLAPGGTVYNPAVVPPFTPAYTLSGVPAGYTELPVSVTYPTTNFPYNYIAGTTDHAYFGSVTSRVYKNNSNGTLAFSYKFNDLVPPAPPDSNVNYDINHVTMSDLTNPWAGVGILGVGSDSGGVSTAVPGAFSATGWTNGNPFDILRAGPAGDQGIGAFFSLNGGTILNRGTAASPINNTSALFWVTTDATRFRLTNVGLQDSQSTVGSAQAYAPFVPEPSTLILSELGCLLGCGLAIRRRLGRQRA